MRLMDFFSSLGVWNWFIVAVVLFVLETIVSRRAISFGSA